MDECAAGLVHAQGLPPVRVNGPSGQDLRDRGNGHDEAGAQRPRQHLDDSAPHGEEEERPGQRSDADPQCAGPGELVQQLTGSAHRQLDRDDEQRDDAPEDEEGERGAPHASPLVLVISQHRPVRAAGHRGHERRQQHGGDDDEHAPPEVARGLLAEERQVSRRAVGVRRQRPCGRSGDAAQVDDRCEDDAGVEEEDEHELPGEVSRDRQRDEGDDGEHHDGDSGVDESDVTRGHRPAQEGRTDRLGALEVSCDAPPHGRDEDDEEGQEERPRRDSGELQCGGAAVLGDRQSRGEDELEEEEHEGERERRDADPQPGGGPGLRRSPQLAALGEPPQQSQRDDADEEWCAHQVDRSFEAHSTLVARVHADHAGSAQCECEEDERQCVCDRPAAHAHVLRHRRQVSQ